MPRPRKDDLTRRTEWVRIRLTKGELAQLTDQAERHACNLADWARVRLGLETAQEGVATMEAARDLAAAFRAGRRGQPVEASSYLDRLALGLAREGEADSVAVP